MLSRSAARPTSLRTRPEDTSSGNLSTGKLPSVLSGGRKKKHSMFDCIGVFSNLLFIFLHIVCANRLRSTLDKGGAVKNFVDALQQLTNPEMLFKVMSWTVN